MAGFGENLRVLDWIIKRCRKDIDAVETPIGYVPAPDAINIEGLDLPDEVMEKLIAVSTADWVAELDGLEEFYAKFGDRLPAEIWDEFRALKNRLSGAAGQ